MYIYIYIAGQQKTIANMLYTYSINHIEIEVSKVEDKLEENRGKVQGGDQDYKNDERECDKLKTHNTR